MWTEERGILCIWSTWRALLAQAVAGGWSCNTMAGLACARASYASQAIDGESAASQIHWTVCLDFQGLIKGTTITCTQRL